MKKINKQPQKNTVAAAIKCFDFEGVSVKGFINFCKNNIPLIIAVSIALFYAFGIRLFWYSIGTDTEIFMSNKPGMLEWHTRIGRFGHALLSKFLYIGEFNPFTAFFTAFCLIWFFTISWCYVIAVFSRDTVKNYKLIPFALMFVTMPVWAEQFFFLLQAAENALIISLCPYVIYLLFKGFLDNEKGKIICAAVLLVLMISVYQGILILFCCGVFICFLLLSENTGYTPQVYRNLCLKLLLVLIGSLAVYFFIDRIIIPAIFNFEKSNYLEAMNKWGQKPFGRIIFDFFLYIYTLTIGHIPLVQKIFNPIIARNAYAWAGADVYLNNVSRISGNVLLLPATVLFLVNVTIIMRRAIPQGRKLLYLLAGIGIPLCIIILVITGGSWPPLRSQYALPLATAFMLFFLIKKFKKKAAVITFCLTLLVAAYQAQITAQLFYSDQLRYNEDVRLAYELNNLIAKAQGKNSNLPVVLVGRYQMAPRFHANFLQGEVIGRSVFETGTDSAFKTTGRAQAFMKSLGLYFDMPTEAQAEQAYNEAVTMPPFPDPLCIKVMRDYVVIRISETLYW